MEKDIIPWTFEGPIRINLKNTVNHFGPGKRTRASRGSGPSSAQSARMNTRPCADGRLSTADATARDPKSPSRDTATGTSPIGRRPQARWLRHASRGL